MSDIDTVVVDSLKVLDPKRPIREADIVPDKSRHAESKRYSAKRTNCDYDKRRRLPYG